MQEVWVVHSGCSYEGGGLDGLFSTEQKAIWYAKRKVHLANQHYRRANPRRKRQHIERAYKVSKEEAKKMQDRFVWKRVDKHVWECHSDYISVSSWKVN